MCINFYSHTYIIYSRKPYFLLITVKIFLINKLLSCTDIFTYKYELYLQIHIKNPYFLYEFYTVSL